VTDLPAVGWENAPGRVVIVAEIEQINLIQDKIRLVAAAWSVALPDSGRMIFTSGSGEPVRELYAGLDTLRGAFSGPADVVPSKGPFALVIVDQGPLHVDQCRLLTDLEGKPAVVVGQKPHRQISHPIVVDEVKSEASHG
jgi:hypothetical protein